MDFHHESFYLDPLILVKDFNFCYENSSDISCQIDELEIYPGECLALCGPSGSGKSTFIKLVNGLIPDYYPGNFTGTFISVTYPVGEKSVEDFSYHVTSVFQNPATQFFHRKVKHELVFPCENQGELLENIEDKLEGVSQEFNLTDKLERDIFSLSGGEKERVALGTALMQDTDLMVFDEPTANLDRAGIDLLAQQLKKLKGQGKTLLIAEHRLDYLTEIVDRYLYFDQGKLKRIYSKEEFLTLEERERKALSLRSLRVDHFIQKIKEKSPLSQTKPKGDLELKHFQLKVGKTLLKELDALTISKGEILGLIGQNGKGKSTFAAYLTGLLDSPEFSVTWQGERLNAKERLQKVALVMQEVRFQLFSDSVEKELVLGVKEEVNSQEVVERLGLSSLLKRHPMTLSGGEQQRLVIASSLLSHKDIFIFDEPTSGLDYQSMKQVASLLKDLSKQGKIVILISHDEELLESVCNRFIRF